ncbi:MAG: peptidoglycan DD-metalloendopeptidase family protein [Bacteroidota bacterium]
MNESIWSKAVFLLFLSLAIGSQHGIAQLISSRESLQKKILLTDQLLQETENRQDKTQIELSVIARQLSLRKRLIIQMTDEIEDHNQEIEASQKLICAMETDINQILSDYGKTAQMTYERFQPESFWTQVLSAGSLSQALQRVSYFKQLSRYRHRQITLIQQAQKYLVEKAEELALTILDKEALIQQKEIEMEKLAQTKGYQTRVYAALKEKAQAYRRQLHVQQAELKKQIRAAENTYLLTAEKVDSDYSRTFGSSQGFLPWPVSSSRGVIVGQFGETEDAFGNRIDNDGIFIRTPKGQPVRSVHSGKVTGVQQIPMSGAVVIVEHGDYRTVYANLMDVSVNIGELVSANQRLGVVRTDPRTEESVLNFLIYEVPERFLNPQNWIIEP